MTDLDILLVSLSNAWPVEILGGLLCIYFWIRIPAEHRRVKIFVSEILTFTLIVGGSILPPWDALLGLAAALLFPCMLTGVIVGWIFSRFLNGTAEPGAAKGATCMALSAAIFVLGGFPLILVFSP